MGFNIRDLKTLPGIILLLGDTGTGKSYCARDIHAQSDLKRMSFYEVNLATLTESLIESELFGHIKGAFTGAINDKKGFCESVGKGVLFLDEVGELSLTSQKKLLLLLEEKIFTPVGSCGLRKFNGKIIAATNRNLKQMVLDGTFREDLFFRLQQFCYQLSPLVDDVFEIEKFMDKFLRIFRTRQEKYGLNYSKECYELLKRYHWPGNIRQLKNCIEYAVFFAEEEIKKENLPDWFIKSVDKINDRNELTNFPFKYNQAHEEFEQKYFRYVLQRCEGKINYTAKIMGISKATLIAKARKYAINTAQIKADFVAKRIAEDRV